MLAAGKNVPVGRPKMDGSANETCEPNGGLESIREMLNGTGKASPEWIESDGLDGWTEVTDG